MAADVARLSAHLNNVSLVDVWINEFIPPGIASAADRCICVGCRCISDLLSCSRHLTDDFPVIAVIA